MCGSIRPLHPWAAGLWLAASALALAQPAGSPEPRLRVESDLVLIPALVTDKDYRPVFDLERRHFSLRVDRQPQAVAAFWRDTGPVSAVIVLDSSGSMASVLRRSKEAVDAFLSLSQQGDEYALVLCQEHGRVAVPFTPHLERLMPEILAAQAHGSTPLLDSVQLAFDLVKKGRHERKVILVISDGEDTSSRVRFTEVRMAALESKAWLYALEFWTGRPIDGFEEEPLRELAELTGGPFFDNVPVKKLAEYLRELDLHQRYILAFKPANRMFDGRRHQVEVRLQAAERLEKPRVFWRRIYVDEPGVR